MEGKIGGGGIVKEGVQRGEGRVLKKVAQGEGLIEGCVDCDCKEGGENRGDSEDQKGEGSGSRS